MSCRALRQTTVFATMLIMALVVVGWFSYGRSASTAAEDRSPHITVTTRLPARARGDGNANHEARRGSVNTISGLDELRSSTTEGIPGGGGVRAGARLDSAPGRA